MAGERSYPPRTKDECRLILSKVDAINPIVALMLEFSALTGLRFSDVTRLKFSNLMINGQWRDELDVIQVKTFNKRITLGQKASDAKSKSRVRVFINDQCKELLDDALRLSGGDTRALAFESSKRKGMPYSAQYVNRILKAVAFDLKLNYPLSTHSFRKAFALFMITGGAKIHQLRDALGHSSLMSTDAYLQTFMNEYEEFANTVTF